MDLLNSSVMLISYAAAACYGATGIFVKTSVHL